MNIKPFVLVILLIGVIAAACQPARAHLEAGADTNVGDFLVDFGYAPSPVIETGRTTLAFNLLQKDTKPADIDSVWLRISNDHDVLFAGSFKPYNGNVTLTYTFPAAGTYEITSRFQKNGKTLAETSNRVRVDALPGTIPHGTLINIFSALGSGVLIGLIIRKARS